MSWVNKKIFLLLLYPFNGSKRMDRNNNTFLKFCELLDGIKYTYRRVVPKQQSPNKYPPEVPDEPYLITHLKYVLDENVQKGALGGCWTCSLKDGSKDNPRVGIPSTICFAIRENGGEIVDRAKKPMTWISCYVYNVRPDIRKEGWENFNCSHRCLAGNCCNPDHLVWESVSTNISRGYRICQRECTHCGGILCVCQGIHDPPCIKKE